MTWDHDAGYDRDDIKHPDHAENMLEWADDQRKRDRENGIGNPVVKVWQEEQQAAAAIFGRCESRTHNSRCILPEGHSGGCYHIAGQGL